MPDQDLKPGSNSGYWTTLPCEGTNFNDFIFYGLRQNILGIVIIDGMSGSSWDFKCFVSLSLKVLDYDVKTVI